MPFLFGAVAAPLLAPLQRPAPTGAQVAGAWLATLIAVGAALTVPWERLPAWTETLPPICYLIVVAIFEGEFGGIDMQFDGLIVIPIVWVALYGSRRQLVGVAGLSLATLIGSAVTASAPDRATESVTAVVLWLVIGLAGFVVHRLVSQIERQAEESRLVIRTARDAFTATDTTGAIVEWSPNAARMFGWTRDEVIGRNLTDTIIAEELRSDHRAALTAIAAEEGADAAERRVEFEAITRTGERFPIEIATSSSPWGGHPQTNSFIRDITRRKRLEEDRERLLEGERAAREVLELQNWRLAELDDLRNEFVSLTSHELRTPLHSILGYSELLLEGGELERDQVTSVQVIHRNASRLMRLANDLLVVAQAATDSELTLTTGATRLDEVVAEAVAAIRPAADERSITLDVTLVAVLLERADAARLGQVADNLLSNAVKFSTDGGRVYVALHASPGRAVLEVRDQGSGIDADAAGRVFDRFYRAPDAVAQGVPGTGLGLTVVKRIVEAHGGAITFTSAPGVGTTVRIELPRGGTPNLLQSDPPGGR
jgi:PAS domain S-box-containing protein